jgi:PAS domain S-box-containing protein
MRVLYVATDLRDADILRQEVRRVEPGLTLDICAGLSELRARPDQPSAYDVLLMDCALAEPEQLQLIHYVRVRQLGMPVVAVSPANGPVPTAALSAGVDDYLVRGPKFADRLGPALRLSADRYKTVSNTLREFEKLKRSEARLRLIIEALPTGVVLLDQTGKVLAMNMAGVQQFGITSPQDIVGRSFTTLMPMEDHPAMQEFVAKAVGGEEASVQFSSTRDEGGRAFNLRGLCIQRDTAAGQSSVLGVLERVNGTATLQPAWSPDFDLDVAMLTSSSPLPAAPLDDHLTEELQARVRELEARGQAADTRIGEMEGELLRLRGALEQAQLRESSASEQLKRAHDEASQLVVESGSLRQALWNEQEQRTTAEEHARAAQQAVTRAEEGVRKAEEQTRALEEQVRQAEERVRVHEAQVRGATEHTHTIEEQARHADDRARNAEEQARQAQEQARRAEEHAREADQQRQALEAQRHAVEEQGRGFEEQKRILDEQRITSDAHVRAMEEQRHAAEEGKRIVDEQRRVAENECRVLDERRREAEEASRHAEDRARQAEEALRKAEDQVRLNEEQLRLKHEELNGKHEELRVAHEQSHGKDEQLRQVHEQLRGGEEHVRHMQEQLRGLEDEVRRAQEQQRSIEGELQQAREQWRGAEDRVQQAQDQLRDAEDQARQIQEQVRAAAEHARQMETRAQSAEEQARHAAEAQHGEALAAVVTELQQARAGLATVGESLEQQRAANELLQQTIGRRDAQVAELELRAQSRISAIEQEHRLAVERLQELLDHAMKESGAPSPASGGPLTRNGAGPGGSAMDATKRGYERVGRLATAMSDDLLAAIQTAKDTAHAVLEVLPAGSQGHDQAKKTIEAVDKCGELARHLLRLSSRHASQSSRVDLAQLVRHQEPLLHHLAGPDIDLQFELALGLSSMELDAQDVTQVLTSLIVAARDALPLGGVIRIGTAYQHRAHDASPDAARGAERPRPLMLGVTAKGYGIRPVSSATCEEVTSRCGGTLTTVIEPNVSWTLIAMLPGGVADTIAAAADDSQHEDLTRTA